MQSRILLILTKIITERDRNNIKNIKKNNKTTNKRSNLQVILVPYIPQYHDLILRPSHYIDQLIQNTQEVICTWETAECGSAGALSACSMSNYCHQ